MKCRNILKTGVMPVYLMETSTKNYDRKFSQKITSYVMMTYDKSIIIRDTAKNFTCNVFGFGNLP